MANPEHLEILKQGVDVWNKWRKENPRAIPDLRGTKLRYLHLKGANLRRANLSNAYLAGTSLVGVDLFLANLSGANLRAANLSRANLRSANLCEADLSGANLRGANLSRTFLIEAKLRGADLSETYLHQANLMGANLSEADLSGANLRGANIIRADLSETDLSKADLTLVIFNNKDLNELIKVITARRDSDSCMESNLSSALCKSSSYKNKSPDCYDEVSLGVFTPLKVHLDSEFVVRFAAYTDSYLNDVIKAILNEAPTANHRLDLETCRWKKGATVGIRLSCSNAEVTNPDQEFIWNGAWQVIRFDVKLPTDIDTDSLILKFDITVQGFPIISIRPEIVIEKRKGQEYKSLAFNRETAPRSAFASYAKKDRKEVLGRVRSLEIFTNIDVFLDCLSIRPGEQWKESLKNEIQKRDIFWLFWSRNAIASEWVEWEWRTALKNKSITGIQPHPLEPAETAPPPKELSDLQFGSVYEWYISQLS